MLSSQNGRGTDGRGSLRGCETNVVVASSRHAVVTSPVAAGGFREQT